MIILDFETNTTNQYDVIEVAAVKVEIVEDVIIIKDKLQYDSELAQRFETFLIQIITNQKHLKLKKSVV